MADLFADPCPQPDHAHEAPFAQADSGDGKTAATKDPRPLAERLRPAQLSEVVGQDQLLGAEGPIGRMVEQGRVKSLVLWGPPGVGKTTIARLLAQAAGLRYAEVSAIFTGVADLKKQFDAARLALTQARQTLLFVDEIHRFNRSQQDSFLPVVEDGTIVLVGATTENPSFELNSALLSRMQVCVLNRLDAGDFDQLLVRAEQAEGLSLDLSDEVRRHLMALADGDGRYFLSMIEQLAEVKRAQPDLDLDLDTLTALVSARPAQYDRAQEAHYNLISALHKSLRGSDVDAALYWFNRMLAGGEDPNYIARRLTRFASEDIGTADPQALVQALSAWQAFERIGSPEGELNLAQAVIYLATAPKSNAVYNGYKSARRAATAHGSLMPPKHALNAPTKMMKDQGYGAGYSYDHEAPDGFSGQDYFPEEMSRQAFFAPKAVGFERDLQKRLEYWQRLRDERNAKDHSST